MMLVYILCIGTKLVYVELREANLGLNSDIHKELIQRTNTQRINRNHTFCIYSLFNRLIAIMMNEKSLEQRLSKSFHVYCIFIYYIYMQIWVLQTIYTVLYMYSTKLFILYFSL